MFLPKWVCKSSSAMASREVGVTKKMPHDPTQPGDEHSVLCNVHAVWSDNINKAKCALSFLVFFHQENSYRDMFYSNPHRRFHKHVWDAVYVSNGVFGLQSWVRVALPRAFVQTYTCSLSHRARRPFFFCCCSHPEVCLYVHCSLWQCVSVTLCVYAYRTERPGKVDSDEHAV